MIIFIIFIIILLIVCYFLYEIFVPVFWGFLFAIVAVIIIKAIKYCKIKVNETKKYKKFSFSIEEGKEWYCPECDYKNKNGYICKNCGYEAKAVTKPKHIKEYSAEALGVMAKPIKENTPTNSEFNIKQELLPHLIDGMPYSYSYENVHICTIKDRMPDINKIKACAYENAAVTVKLEPENLYDNEAVALYTANDIHMGYLYKNRLKDMAYDYLKKGLPIRAQIVKIEREEIFINIAFYAPEKKITYTNEITFTLLSRSEEMQDNLYYIDINDEVDFYFDDDKEKFVFTSDNTDIGYAPKKYEELLEEIEHYNCKIIEVNELESGNFSVKISIQYAD